MQLASQNLHLRRITVLFMSYPIIVIYTDIFKPNKYRNFYTCQISCKISFAWTTLRIKLYLLTGGIQICITNKRSVPAMKLYRRKAQLQLFS